MSFETPNSRLVTALYPRLFHVAAAGAWESIAAFGLMSAARLAERAGLPPDRREQLLRSRRPGPETLPFGRGRVAVLRDQGPLHASKLASALHDGTSVADWLELLNGYVFLWPTRKRVDTLLAAYRDDDHDVIAIDTHRLLERYAPRTLLSHMNTGATSPIAHARGRDTFRPLASYPLEERRRSYGAARAVAEVVVEDAIPDVRDMIVSVERYRGTRRLREIVSPAVGEELRGRALSR